MWTEAVRVGEGVGEPVEGTPWATRIGYSGTPPPPDPELLASEDFEETWFDVLPYNSEDFEVPWEQLLAEDFEQPWSA